MGSAWWWIQGNLTKIPGDYKLFEIYENPSVIKMINDEVLPGGFRFKNKNKKSQSGLQIKSENKTDTNLMNSNAVKIKASSLSSSKSMQNISVNFISLKQ